MKSKDVRGPYQCPRSNLGMASDVAKRTFDWFLANTNPKTGLVLDRNDRPNMAATTAGTGFAIICYAIANEYGWITRSQAREYVLKLLRFLADAPQGPEAQGKSGYRGFFYHFLDPNTGLRMWNSELSSIDTALLMVGVLFARNYFSWRHREEKEIRHLAGVIYERVQWSWMQKADGTISMAWTPEGGLYESSYAGYCECLVLYVLASGSRRYAVRQGTWDQAVLGFKDRYIVGRLNDSGPTFVRGPGMPAFFEQYNNLIPFRGIQDRVCRDLGIDYYSNGEISTRAQLKYALANVGRWQGYSRVLWGLTACDGPGAQVSVSGILSSQHLDFQSCFPSDSYFSKFTAEKARYREALVAERRLVNVRLAEPSLALRSSGPLRPSGVLRLGLESDVAQGREFRAYSERGVTGFDDGTIAPTAAFGSLMFAPRLVLPMMRNLLSNYPEVFDEHGFADALNLTVHKPDVWIDRDPSGRLEHLSIDQGPIIHAYDRWVRPGWYEFVMRNDPAIRKGLIAAGFSGGWLD